MNKVNVSIERAPVEQGDVGVDGDVRVVVAEHGRGVEVDFAEHDGFDPGAVQPEVEAGAAGTQADGSHRRRFRRSAG